VTAKPRVLTITQSTYDGILYNVEEIKEMLDGKIDTLHFDEAWLPHAAFHDFYGDYHAIGADRPRCKESMVFSTQSTHKLLAGLSQASQILVQNSEGRELDRSVFNEAYLMHTSTSPQYAIIASCDVAAAMMEAPAGTALVEESIAEALDFRRAMRKVDEEWGADWWFKVWGPDDLSEEGIEERDAWMLKPGERWHGFGQLSDGFNMLDPIKATIITPGLDVDGDFRRELRHPGGDRHQVPRRARRHRREVRPLFVLHHVHHRHHQGPLEHDGHRAAAVQGRLRQEPAAVEGAARVRRQAPVYERIGLKDLCHLIHGVYALNDVARLTTEMYLSDMVPAMKPTDAFAKMAHREIDRVPIDELEGRITSILLTPYPPGIPLLIPGERFNKTIVRYLKFARDFNEQFPGFETDIHGLVKEVVDGKPVYYVDCVR
jgi:arginine decarboxylase